MYNICIYIYIYMMIIIYHNVALIANSYAFQKALWNALQALARNISNIAEGPSCSSRPRPAKAVVREPREARRTGPVEECNDRLGVRGQVVL